MKVQFLNGGLANQAFQYIFARYYELSHPEDRMYMDDTYFALNTVHNGYELEKVFNIHPHMLSECFDDAVWSHILEEKRKGKSVPQIFYENRIDIRMVTDVVLSDCEKLNPFEGEIIPSPSNKYFPEIQEISGNVYYHGYWINKGWFERYQDIFWQEFCFPEIMDEKNQRYQEQILMSDSISMHVRRGDYVKLKWDLGTEIYQKALKKFSEQISGEWHLFVFSDDISWCKEHERQLGVNVFSEVTYVEGNVNGKNYLDLQLMSMCRAMVISTSAFCYLAVLLNRRKRYIVNLSSREL